MQSQNCAVHSQNLEIVQPIWRLRDHSLQTFHPNHATDTRSFWEVLLWIRGITRILRQRRQIRKLIWIYTNTHSHGRPWKLGMHAQLIHTHRQFKVQYSTYATLPPSKISQNKSSLCGKTITDRRSANTSRSPRSRGLRTVRHWSKVIRPSTRRKVNVFNKWRGMWWICLLWIASTWRRTTRPHWSSNGTKGDLLLRQ